MLLPRVPRACTPKARLLRESSPTTATTPTCSAHLDAPPRISCFIYMAQPPARRAAPCPGVRAAPEPSPAPGWAPGTSLRPYSGKEGEAPTQTHTCVSLWHLHADAHISRARRGRCAWSLRPQTLADKPALHGPSQQLHESRPVLYCGHWNRRINHQTLTPHQCWSPGASQGYSPTSPFLGPLFPRGRGGGREMFMKAG